MNWLELAGKIPPLVWLFAFIFFGTPAVASKMAAKIPGVLGATARWWQARKIAQVSQDELGRISTELHELRADYDRVVPDLRERVNKLEEALDHAQRRLWAFRDYVRDLKDMLRRHAPDAPMPKPPEEISDLV